MEIDQDPTIGFTSDLKYHLHPIPLTIKTMTLPCLFAGNINSSAVLTKDKLVELISKKIKEIDFGLAKSDILTGNE